MSADHRKRGAWPLNRPGSKARPSDAGALGKRSSGNKGPDVGCGLTPFLAFPVCEVLVASWVVAELRSSWETGIKMIIGAPTQFPLSPSASCSSPMKRNGGRAQVGAGYVRCSQLPSSPTERGCSSNGSGRQRFAAQLSFDTATSPPSVAVSGRLPACKHIEVWLATRCAACHRSGRN